MEHTHGICKIDLFTDDGEVLVLRGIPYWILEVIPDCYVLEVENHKGSCSVLEVDMDDPEFEFVELDIDPD